MNRTTQRDVKLSNNSLISHEAYAYDPLRPGLLTSVARLEQGQSQKQDTFAYDLMGALKTAQYDIPSGGGAARTCGYVWDKAGNRSSMSDSAGPSCSYQTTCLNQYSLVGGEVVGQGNWHELGSYQNIAYTYVNDTRLASVTGIGHTYRVFYDALGRCVVRTMDGSTSCYVYDGEKPIVEYGTSFAKTATNIYGREIDEILQRTDFTYLPNRLFYYQDDHEGNVTHDKLEFALAKNAGCSCVSVHARTGFFFGFAGDCRSCRCADGFAGTASADVSAGPARDRSERVDQPDRHARLDRQRPEKCGHHVYLFGDKDG